ncbi:MAG: 4Fe-4S dicluster domain-containing protein [Bacteroidales bacterium]|nr:4Fe-4S dicluster domain-containing protein [Bacteroidales bacterium]
MDLHRRDFLKVMCATGLTLATGKALNAAPKDKNVPEFYGILYDSVRCKGCRGCEYDCADANGLPEPEPTKNIKGLRKPDENRRTVINEHKTSKGTVYVKMQCMHCNEPACAAACLTQAMSKTKEGPVIWRGDKCMGCRYCMVSCPFDMPKFEYHSPNPKIQKCTMCYDTRILKGELPACVENCPNEALMFGTRRELISEARRRIYEKPGEYVEQIYGEHEAGGSGWLYLSPVPFEELGMNTSLQNASYPALTKGFLYSVPSVFVLVPALLLGIQQATKKNHPNEESDDE